ncbi:DUF3750 domain-containing protein [Marivibrio halodurans]
MTKFWNAMVRGILALGLLLILLLAGPLTMLASSGAAGSDWRSASREIMGLAPDPVETPGAVVQVYAARAYGWRGAFGVHSWIAVKPAGADDYRSYHVLGWRARHGGNSVVTRTGPPDREWYGNPPQLIAHLEGPEAEAAIPLIEERVDAYPHARTYHVWPGPNSNTFTAWVARGIPALELDLPPTAIGKDYRPATGIVGQSVSGTGVQVSLFGLLGVTAALREGLEINIAGMTFGVDPDDMNLKLPGIGRIGPPPDRRAGALSE